MGMMTTAAADPLLHEDDGGSRIKYASYTYNNNNIIDAGRYARDIMYILVHIEGPICMYTKARYDK